VICFWKCYNHPRNSVSLISPESVIRTDKLFQIPYLFENSLRRNIHTSRNYVSQQLSYFSHVLEPFFNLFLFTQRFCTAVVRRKSSSIRPENFSEFSWIHNSPLIIPLIRSKNSFTTFLFTPSPSPLITLFGVLIGIRLFPFKRVENQPQPAIFYSSVWIVYTSFFGKVNTALRTWHSVQPKPLLAKSLNPT
jgi:hypothetical protein